MQILTRGVEEESFLVDRPSRTPWTVRSAPPGARSETSARRLRRPTDVVGPLAETADTA
ncbi:hypothetical protein ACH4MA_13660 [Streptomyces roseolus]|uniref:hypothetical protein n=1 Tax=Streptomyces roseolus TaxID=67358 RepID=UPI0037AC14E8